MKSAIGKAGRRLFAQDDDARQYAASDTVSEQYVAVPTDAEGTDYRAHDVPPGLSERDTTVLRTVKRRANILDKHFNLCGARFGWTFIIAIIPVVGDALHPVFGYLLVVRSANKAKLPKALTRRMILNLAISAAIGIVPIIGDVLLASYRANVRNARLLENFLLLRGERVARGGGSGGASSRTAPAAAIISEKGRVDGDEGGDSEEARGTPGRSTEEDNARALLEKQRPDAASLSQPGAGGASSSECEKTALVLDGAEEGDHEKDKGADVAALVPDVASEGEGVGTQLRPPRNPLEFVQHRDSRFIEDVT